METPEKPFYLSCPGAQLSVAERDFLRDQAAAAWGRHGTGVVIVNIGCMWGASLACLAEGAPGARLVGVDIDFETYGLWFTKFEQIHGDSTQVHADFKGRIHLLFIDGGHDYETVKQDIAGWVPKVADDDGVVIFHDYDPMEDDLARYELGGVRRAVDEWVLEQGARRGMIPVLPSSLVAFGPPRARGGSGG